MTIIMRNSCLYIIGILLLSSQVQSYPAHILSWDFNGIDYGDLVKKEMVGKINIGKKGEDCLWNFSKLKNKGKMLTEYSNTVSCIFEYENRRNNNYVYRNDSLLLAGFSEAGLFVEYVILEMVMRYPLTFGDSVGSIFWGEGEVARDVYIRNAGISGVCADAHGSILLPGGDTLRNVLRTHYSRTGTTFLANEFRRSFRYTNDSSLISRDSINHWLCSDSVLHHIEIWRWYAEGFRYPVFERRDYTITKFGIPVDSLSLSFYISPKVQMSDLEYDPENEALREEIYDSRHFPYLYARSGGGEYNGKSVGSGDVENGMMAGKTGCRLECHISSASGSNVLTIRYMIESSSDADISVYSSAGKLMWRKENVGGYGMNSVDVPMDGYIDGEYLVLMVVGDEVYSEKVLKL